MSCVLVVCEDSDQKSLESYAFTLESQVGGGWEVKGALKFILSLHLYMYLQLYVGVIRMFGDDETLE